MSAKHVTAAYLCTVLGMALIVLSRFLSAWFPPLDGYRVVLAVVGAGLFVGSLFSPLWIEPFMAAVGRFRDPNRGVPTKHSEDSQIASIQTWGRIWSSIAEHSVDRSNLTQQSIAQVRHTKFEKWPMTIVSDAGGNTHDRPLTSVLRVRINGQVPPVETHFFVPMDGITIDPEIRRRWRARRDPVPAGNYQISGEIDHVEWDQDGLQGVRLRNMKVGPRG